MKCFYYIFSNLLFHLFFNQYRSLSYNHNIIIADEPTGNLDRETESEILKIFKDLAIKENKCIIIVTHSKNVCESSDIVYDLKSN